jgi:hypothetical protein
VSTSGAERQEAYERLQGLAVRELVNCWRQAEAVGAGVAIPPLDIALDA